MKHLFRLVTILSWNFICSLIGIFVTLLVIGIIGDKLDNGD